MSNPFLDNPMMRDIIEKAIKQSGAVNVLAEKIRTQIAEAAEVGYQAGIEAAATHVHARLAPSDPELAEDLRITIRNLKRES